MAPISVTLAPRDPPAAVVALVGEHDTYSAGRLEAELSVLLDEALPVVVDLRDTEFIDSTTLGALLAARRTAKQSGVGFTFVLPGRNYTEVNQLLDLTGLGSSFAIFETLDEALTAARRGTSHGGDSQQRKVA
jgi:anti-anti-sigma factor